MINYTPAMSRITEIFRASFRSATRRPAAANLRPGPATQAILAAADHAGAAGVGRGRAIDNSHERADKSHTHRADAFRR